MNTPQVRFGVASALVILALGTAVYEAREAHTARVALTAANLTCTDMSQRLQLAERRAEEASRSAAASAATASTPPAASVGMSERGTLARLRTLVDLQKRKLLDSHMTFVNPAGRLSESFVELFGPTEQEQATLQQTLDRAREQLTNLQIANATVSRNDKGEYIISVKPFAEGSAVYDQLLDAFSQTLGPDRNAAFLALGANQLEQTLGHFGAEAKTITIGRNTSPNGPDNQYQVTDRAHQNLSSWSSTSNFPDRDAVVKRVGALAKLLPPDF
jgi:hypothetical protein